MAKRRASRPPRLAVFDSEGTTLDMHPPYAVLYSWDFLICDGEPSDVSSDTVQSTCHHVEGRDVSSLYSQIRDMAEDAYESGYCWRVGVHNLTYDACYLRHIMVHCDEMGLKCDVVARSSTKLLTISFRRKRTRVLTFFDTLALFGCSLRTLGANLGFEKLHIDYAEDLSPETVLSADNVAYNHRDTEVLMCAICESLLTRESVSLDDLGTRVLTKTSIVRKGDRESPFIGALPIARREGRGKGLRKTKVSKMRTVYDADRFVVGRHQYGTREDLQSWASYGSTVTADVKGFFAGGVNISNSNLLGVTLRDVVSYDLKSAYPAIMLSYRIPSNPREVEDLDEYKYLLDPCIPDPVGVMTGRFGFWYGTVAFTGFDVDEDWAAHVGDSTLTQTMVLQHARESSGLVFADGYLRHADVLVLTIATPEFYELCLQYSWESAAFNSLVVYDSQEMPTWYSVLRTVHHFREKSVAKRVSKCFARGERPDSDVIDGWQASGFVTFDEAEALRRWDVSESWVESFVMSHKGNLNSLYGIMVTDPLKDDYSLDDWGYLQATDDDAWDAYADTGRDSLMWREAGVCVSLYNRYKIAYFARLVVESGQDVAYVDTDSIKVPGGSKDALDDLFSATHARIEQASMSVLHKTFEALGKRHEAMQVAGVDVTYPAFPDEPEFRDLGKLDYEGTFAEFVTTGHKRYAYTTAEGAPWRYKCSGYALDVLHNFGRQLEADGLHSLAPLLVLGYDVRYDSSTHIASAQSGIDDTWVDVSFEALREQGSDARVLYEGQTCPGYAILDAGKVMNDTSGSLMNLQRFEAACRNNPAVREASGIDVRRDGGRFVFGKRGNVHMDWHDWALDFGKGCERQS